MNGKKIFHWTITLIIISLALAGCGGQPVQPTATLNPPTNTPIPPTNTPVPSPTLPPVPTAISGSKDPMTVGDFTFQITEVQIADSIVSISGPASNYKGALVMAANGWMPKDAVPGDKLLSVITLLQSGDFKSFIDSDLKIIEQGSKKSTVVVLTQEQDNRVIWVYDVKPSSTSFLLEFPDGASIDLSPLMP